MLREGPESENRGGQRHGLEGGFMGDFMEAFEIVEERMNLNKPMVDGDRWGADSDFQDSGDDECDDDWQTECSPNSSPRTNDTKVEPPQVAKMPIITVKGSSKMLTVIEDYTNAREKGAVVLDTEEKSAVTDESEHAATEVVQQKREETPSPASPSVAVADLLAPRRGSPVMTVPPEVKEMNPLSLKRTINKKESDIRDLYEQHQQIKAMVAELELEESALLIDERVRGLMGSYHREIDILRSVNESFRCQAASLKELVNLREQEIVSLRVNADKAAKKIAEQDNTIRRLHHTVQESQSINMHLKNKVQDILGRFSILQGSEAVA